jgi:hypothetical protein
VKRDEGMELRRWTKKMIWKHKRSTLSLDREERHQSIVWDPPPAGYQEGGEYNEKSEEEDEEC